MKPALVKESNPRGYHVFERRTSTEPIGKVDRREFTCLESYEERSSASRWQGRLGRT